MQNDGFTVKKGDSQKMAEIRSAYKIPAELQSCHVAIVGGYIIEGHVPSIEIRRLLAEQPDFTGLAVPGMPPGSPGMDSQDGEIQPFDVVAFGDDGYRETYASYPK